jgi:hypothetical protein
MSEERNPEAAVLIGSLGGLMAGYGLVQEPIGWITLIIGLALVGVAVRNVFS